MNVLILTPDGVGSTLLQRALTVQMLLSNFDKPVINIHELTNGLESFYSPGLQTMVLGKFGNRIGYGQSLSEIIDLLETHDHYKTSRLAYYHILCRNDSFVDQTTFYEYLNNNFFIISARRKNLLDYGLSWCLRDISKKLNVYSTSEKVLAFMDLFKDPVTIDIEVLLGHLDEYKDYVDWSTKHFDIGSFYYYESHVGNLENYMHNLPIFAGKDKNKWEDVYNISFNDFNKYHKYKGDIGAIALETNKNLKQLTFQENATKTEFEEVIYPHLPVSTREFVDKHKHNYQKAYTSISHLVKLGVLVSHLPIKKLTFAEKKFVTKNFNDCLNAFNDWIVQYPHLGQPVTDNLVALEFQDNSMWKVKE
jgi:hypothetical protein